MSNLQTSFHGGVSPVSSQTLRYAAYAYMATWTHPPFQKSGRHVPSKKAGRPGCGSSGCGSSGGTCPSFPMTNVAKKRDNPFVVLGVFGSQDETLVCEAGEPDPTVSVQTELRSHSIGSVPALAIGQNYLARRRVGKCKGAGHEVKSGSARIAQKVETRNSNSQIGGTCLGRSLPRHRGWSHK